MNKRLIYHLTNNNESISPFQENIEAIFNEENICIACPYINIYKLQKLLEEKTNFRILTDLEAWIKSSKKQDRNVILEFVKKNHERIHHQNKLHAKVFINQKQAILGSANLTKSGLFSNNEFSILIDTKTEVEEIKNWFETWWKESHSPNIEQVIDFIIAQDEIDEKSPKQVKKIESKSPQIKIIPSDNSRKKINYFILNTNKKDGIYDELDMLKKQKAAAYFSPYKNKIEKYLKKNDRIFLYSSGIGIIAKGIASGVLSKKDYQDNPFHKEEEYSMDLLDFRQLENVITSREINKTAGRTIILNSTLKSIENELGEKLWTFS